jgi:hypothetical protein
MNEIYRLKISTLAILDRNGKPSAVALPAGAVVALRQPQVEFAGGFVEALWDGHSIMLFGCDLKERGERVRSVTLASDY